MKRIIALVLVLCMALSLVACGSAAPKTGSSTTAPAAGGETTADPTAKTGVFMAGYAKHDITPKESVPLDSYGDARDRMSTGLFSYLYAICVALQDADGQLMLFMTCDVSWCPNGLGTQIRQQLARELGIEENYIFLAGTHTHSSVAPSLTDIPSVAKFNEDLVKKMVQAGKDAVADLKPAEVYVGSVMTENMNHVRRYIMDDGSLDGDNAYGTGTKRVSHETQADPEMQLMKFVREGGKDILISQFQAHPHLEGKTNNISAQTVGTIRDAVEADLGALAFHWQGAAGNLNTGSSLEGETPTKDRVEYGKMMGKYIQSVYNDLTKVETGPIQVRKVTYTGQVNHMYDHMTVEAGKVVAYFQAGNTAGATATYAHQFKDANGLRINSYYHANRILSNASQPATKDMDLYAWSFGEVAGAVIPYELFDTSGMQIKTQSPYTRTFICGYSWPSYGGYIPTREGYANGGYESDNSNFAPGTAEGMVENYLNMLNDMHG